MDLPTCTSKLGSLYQRRHHKSSSTLKNLNPFLKRSKPLSTNPPPCSTTLEASFRSVATNSRNINTKKHAPSWFKRYLPRRNKEAYSLEIEAIAREAVDKYLRASSIEYEQRKPAMKMKESEDYLTVKFPNPWTGVLSPYVEDEKRAGGHGDGHVRKTNSAGGAAEARGLECRFDNIKPQKQHPRRTTRKTGNRSSGYGGACLFRRCIRIISEQNSFRSEGTA
ncbi:MAG: hypothetical protein M1812_003055 [Candelaria pacifica]|nr:MAG: hypothetical protein M1812_003055 [Candelaria pacifica]